MQALTTEHKGREVPGGTDLHVVRGDFDALTALDLLDRLAGVGRAALPMDCLP